jgi:hypothetical protein
MGVELAAIFRRGLAFDPEDRPQTLVEFVGSLINSFPMPPHVRERVQESMRQDTQTQDVLPQLVRPLPTRSATSTDPGGRSSPAYPTEKMETLSGLMGQTAATRIQLDHARASQPERPPTRPVASLPRETRTPLVDIQKVLAWVVLVAVLMLGAWFIYLILKSKLGETLP